ncbi:hypothetical protein Ocin01_16764 [Orchesella cincta]|uniref:Uncharacterized protein n=1 Tax=Orchesella cincta TaxID=48709 RepID=A0A1D2MA96_ORCCI|nr:hypothetical protein Ocin01_16764 [Orchesella cincta]
MHRTQQLQQKIIQADGMQYMALLTVHLFFDLASATIHCNDLSAQKAHTQSAAWILKALTVIPEQQVKWLGNCHSTLCKQL